MNCMDKKEEYWDSILEELKNYKGTLTEFCKEKGVSRNSLYYQRKIRKLINEDDKEKPEITFTKIDIKEPEVQNKTELAICPEEIKTVSNNNDLTYYKNHTINIEIGKAKMVLDSTDKKTLSFIIKELSSTC